jgi:hypothetical protein
MLERRAAILHVLCCLSHSEIDGVFVTDEIEMGEAEVEGPIFHLRVNTPLGTDHVAFR